MHVVKCYRLSLSYDHCTIMVKRKLIKVNCSDNYDNFLCPGGAALKVASGDVADVGVTRMIFTSVSHFQLLFCCFGHLVLFVCTFRLFLFALCTARNRLRDPSTTGSESSIY